MRIDLETPYNPGDNDPGATYPHCKAVLLTHNPVMHCTVVVYEFGHEDDDGTWHRGIGSPASRSVTLFDEELQASAPAAPAHAFQGLELLCYECMVAKGGVVAGTIVGQAAEPPPQEPKP